jgi:hypothetical protein
VYAEGDDQANGCVRTAVPLTIVTALFTGRKAEASSCMANSVTICMYYRSPQHMLRTPWKGRHSPWVMRIRITGLDRARCLLPATRTSN